MTKHRWICGDSFFVVSTMQDKSVDCILTDPPYDFDGALKESWHYHLKRVCRGVVIVFGPPENQWIQPADQYGFWVKPISTKNTSKSYSRFVEMIFFYGRGSWDADRHWSQYTNVFMDLVDDASLHPYRKPPSLIERLVRNHTCLGDLILDPFAGSGVVREVCMRTGRNSFSIEKNSDYTRDSLTVV
jgi:DNA modification methylase